MQLPLIATDVDGCRDAVVNETTGILVPPGDASALASQICRYIADPGLRARHGNAGRERVLKCFQPEPLWEAVRAVYEQHGSSLRRQTWEQLGKRLLDITASATALFLLSPILLLTAIAVWLGLGSPILFKQTRPGLQGKPFTMVKFRTMREGLTLEGYVLPDGERLTNLGRLLRRWSLDELPVLWNVLRGEISLVGPRPLLMQYLPFFKDEEKARLTVPPGITGWAQIHGRNSSPWDKRLADDIWYVRNWSLSLDLKIIILTLRNILRAEKVATDSYAVLPSLDQEREWMRS